MSILTVVTTILYATGLPVFVEAKKVYNRIFDILIKLQNVLIEMANKYLWPWVAELLKMINFESIKKLYEDINAGMNPEQCIQEYINRSGTLEYMFIVSVSAILLVSIAKIVVEPLESHVLSAPIMKQFVQSYPISFRVLFYPFLVAVIYFGYMTTAYILYHLNNSFKK